MKHKSEKAKKKRGLPAWAIVIIVFACLWGIFNLLYWFWKPFRFMVDVLAALVNTGVMHYHMPNDEKTQKFEKDVSHSGVYHIFESSYNTK